jgi:hypothetical protein
MKGEGKLRICLAFPKYRIEVVKANFLGALQFSFFQVVAPDNLP